VKNLAARSFFFRLATALAIVVLVAVLARAGGPEFVAGSSYFNPSTMGQPLTWSLGRVNYYTDQGDLSPILPNNSANVLVADAFAQWTSSSTAALTVASAGQLAEDVNGSNITVDSAGTVTAPADITPSATKTPVGIVYDFDGTVTDALLGAGAGATSQCFWNAVYGGVDNFAVTANFQPRAGGDQRPVRAAVLATHGRGIPAGARMARLVSLGVPRSGKQVNFFIDQGSGSLSSTSAVTNSNGYASVNLTVTNFTVSMQLSACAAPSNNPCQNISADAVAAAVMNLQAVAGAGQVVIGAAFQPLTVRVTDSSTPPNPVFGATVLFQSTLLRPAGNDLILTPGDPTVTQPGLPVFLSASQNTAQSDASGLASFTPSVGSFTGPLELEIQVSAGTAAAMQGVMETFPAAGGNQAATVSENAGSSIK
jgi:hypothetical protein